MCAFFSRSSRVSGHAAPKRFAAREPECLVGAILPTAFLGAAVAICPLFPPKS